MTPARFRWGMIFIQIGILILLRNYEILNDNFWVDLLILFPIVLIAVGVEKIFTKSKLQFISYLTTVGLFVGGFLIAFTGGADGMSSNFFSETLFIEEFQPEVKGIKAVMNVDETDLTIRDSGEDLVYARFDKFTKKPKIESEITDDIAYINLKRKPNSFLGGAIKVNIDDTQEWQISFSDMVPLDLECYGEASDMHLNFTTTPLSNLKVDADDTDIYVKIGDLERKVTVSIGGANNILKLRIPTGFGVKIAGEHFSSYLTTLGFIENDSGFFTTEEFEKAESSVDVKLEDDLESFSLDFF